MKKSTILLAAGLICALISSCTDKKAEFIKRLSETMANDTTSLTSIYPNAKDIELKRVSFNPDSVTVTEGEQEFQLTVGDATFNIVADEQGEYHVESTKGLIKVDPNLMTFAQQTGWYKPELTDKENYIALQDTIFPKMVKEAFINEITSNVSAKLSFYGINYSTMTQKMKVTITNKNELPIKGDMYNVTVKLMGMDWDTMGTTCISKRMYDGIDLAANGSGTIELGTSDAEYTFENGSKAIMEWKENIDISALGFKANGNEYDEYKKQN